MGDKNNHRKPPWLKVRGFGGQSFNDVSALIRDLHLNTVCQAANCPNRGECYTRGTATFLLMGPKCTRNCRFCDVQPGKTSALDPKEPENVAEASRRMKLKYVVVTSVTRDDLPDGGAGHFAETIRALKRVLPESKVEVLTPDFKGVPDALATVLEAGPDVFNHNIETVPELYDSVRPGADYRRSLDLLRNAYEKFSAVTKSGLMVGVGETTEQLKRVFDDMAANHVSVLTIGQYLAPSKEHLPVERYVAPEEFKELGELALSAGLKKVFSGPLVRSSYQADEVFSDLEK